jgi:hypothetical protein
MVVTPAESPMATPVEGSIVPTTVLLLLHTPPGVASASAVVDPTHTVNVPVMGACAIVTNEIKSKTNERKSVFITAI